MDEPRSVEQICRDLLEAAVCDGIVELKANGWTDPHPQARSAGELAYVANLLSTIIRSHDSKLLATIAKQKAEIADLKKRLAGLEDS